MLSPLWGGRLASRLQNAQHLGRSDVRRASTLVCRVSIVTITVSRCDFIQKHFTLALRYSDARRPPAPALRNGCRPPEDSHYDQERAGASGPVPLLRLLRRTVTEPSWAGAS